MCIRDRLKTLFLLSLLTGEVRSNHIGFISSCSKMDRGAPCSCNRILTRYSVHKGGRRIKVEFQEAVCNDTENSQRYESGRIRRGYTCSQLKLDTVLYTDAAFNPVEVPIVYKAGCELRCINPYCKGKTVVLDV